MKASLCSAAAAGVLIASCSGPQIARQVEGPPPLVVSAAEVDLVEGATQFRQSEGGVLLAVSIRSLDRKINPGVTSARSMRRRPVYITGPGELVAVAGITSENTSQEFSAVALSTEASSNAGRPVYIAPAYEFPAVALWFDSQEAAEDCANRLWGLPNPSEDPWVALERHLSNPRSWILPQSEGASGSAWRLPPTGFPSGLQKKYGP
jgi:hypothetical protein